MGGSAISRVKLNAREIALSTDADRAEALASRELQNLLGMGSADVGGTPFSCLLTPLTLTAVAATFTMTLADGDGLFYFPTDPGLTADDSAYEVLRWRSLAPLVFTTPDGTNGRIDLVVAQPAAVDADLTSRTILLDPVARTIAAQNVFKTTNPSSTISIVAGTPGATPAPPAVPAGKVALCEVFVPAAAPDASTFVVVPRLFRRAPFPWSVMSGIMSGLSLRWDLTASTATPSGVQTLSTKNKVVIDGELIEFNSATAPVQDSGNNPFGVAAGASDKPYYFYICGGRHAPQGQFGAGAGFGVPALLIESLTPPDLDNYGHPTAPLTGPRGTIPVAAAVYCGLGFVVATTTNRRACIMDDEWTMIVGTDEAGRLALTKTGTGQEALGTLGSRPPLSRRVYCQLALVAASAIADVFLHPDDGSGTTPSPTSTGVGATNVVGVKTQVAASLALGYLVFAPNPLNAKIWIAGSGLATSDTIQLVAIAYDHRVNRIATG